MDVILACDLGTSSCKLSAVQMCPSANRVTVIATASRPYPTRQAADGWAEQAPDDWLRAFQDAVRDLAASGRLGRVQALCFTGQMSAALPVDAEGQALHPALIWSDQRATREVRQAETILSPERFYALTGNALNATYSAPKLAWLKHNRPEAWRAAATFLQPKDWLIRQLTGVNAMDHSDASCTGLYDLRAGTWSDELFAVFGLSRAMAPPLAEAITRIGALKSVIARQLGLPDGLPVILGGGDGPTSALGVGIGQGEAYVSVGTSGWMSFLHSRPVIDPARRVFTFRHVLPDLYAVTGSTQNAGNVLSWLARLLTITDIGAEVRVALASAPPGAEGLTVLPYLHGERTPYWDSDAAGAMIGMRSHHGRAHVVRAFVEAICFQIRLIMETFADCGLSSSTIQVVGGLTTEASLMTLLATILGKPLVRPMGYTHITALGAALVGARALGLAVDPIAADAPRDAEVIAPSPILPALGASYDTFRALYGALSRSKEKDSL